MLKFMMNFEAMTVQFMRNYEAMTIYFTKDLAWVTNSYLNLGLSL